MDHDTARLCALGKGICGMALAPAVVGPGDNKRLWDDMGVQMPRAGNYETQPRDEEGTPQEFKKNKLSEPKASKIVSTQGVDLVVQGLHNAQQVASRIEILTYIDDYRREETNITKSHSQLNLYDTIDVSKPIDWLFAKANDPTMSILKLEVKQLGKGKYKFFNSKGSQGALLDFEYIRKNKEISLESFYYPAGANYDTLKYPPWMTMFFMCMLSDRLRVPIKIPVDNSPAKSLIYNRDTGLWVLEFESYYGRYGFERSGVKSVTRKPCPKEDLDWIDEYCGVNSTLSNCKKAVQEQKKKLEPQCFIRVPQHVQALANMHDGTFRYIGDWQEVGDDAYVPKGKGKLIAYDKYSGKPKTFEGTFRPSEVLYSPLLSLVYPRVDIDQGDGKGYRPFSFMNSNQVNL